MMDSDWKSDIVIEDFGYGIKKEDMDNIFKRFFRSFDENIQSKEGSGIGLYLSKKIIEEQSGVIKVESKVNKGTKVTISFYKHIVN